MYNLYKSLVPIFRSSVENILPLIKSFRYEILLGTSVFFLAYAIAMFIKKLRSNFPPGPVGLPIVGYSPFLSEDLYLDFVELGKKYGDVFSVRLGSQDIVVLHGSEAIKEALNKPEFLGKPPVSVLELVNPLSAFFGANFEYWKEQRKFVLHSMKDLGLGKTKIEEDIMEEIKHFMQVLKSHNGKPMDVKPPLTPSMSNNIAALVFGKRYEYDDPERQFLDENLEKAIETFAQTSPDVLYPWMRRIPFFTKLLKVDKTLTAYNNFRKFFRKELDKHVQSLDPNNIRDFIDRYLLEIDLQKEKDPNTTFHQAMLTSNAIDIFVPGSDTVRTSILWITYIMAAFPDVQKKVQREIMEVIGSEKTPEYMDMRNMPYTHAVILELLRWKTIVPLNLMRYTLADTTVGGYDIPKGTIVYANFWSAHHDPRYWNEPDKFMPERFLSEDGKSIIKSSHFMPFSLGKRVCPGESMAYMEIFLYFSSLLQNFDIVFPEGTEPTFNAKLNITYRPDHFLVKFVPKS
ncbi:Cytochrome P450 2J2 like protein [Argiope bruennichi]|uniref:Cytochrome P450 2J2 like protein n=1 Tax=Argiope bruennichi TaxID=94029 RepID=A0A8T0FCU6_ARGBR|nr:Cytochrome P450 2J2 like protein [Argiope bruennichi]